MGVVLQEHLPVKKIQPAIRQRPEGRKVAVHLLAVLDIRIAEPRPRDAVFEICKHLKIELKEATITRDELYLADEIFLTGTAAEITPIREIDHRIIGNGKKGKITAKIQKTFFETVAGKVPKFKKWLTSVPL